MGEASRSMWPHVWQLGSNGHLLALALCLRVGLLHWAAGRLMHGRVARAWDDGPEVRTCDFGFCCITTPLA